ncbi:MAG: hypothetical protein IPK22_03495 [Verrucomicrobiaceae bacterium]|nr:hypothetical protein [Verrucomicrobiaceae bacterium]
MKLSRSLLFLALAATSTGLLRADIVTLKDGKKLEGTILEQKPEGVLMKYKVTAKIMDEKFIPMAEIAPGGILKEKPEEVEIKELRKLVPTVDLMTAEKYEQLIQDRLRPFVNRYPGTPQADEIKKMIDELQSEKEKVVSGGIKLEGRWLTAQEARAEKANVDAYLIRQAMNEKAAAGDMSGALREFDQLTDKKKFHQASIYYPKAVEEALAILTTYDAKLSQMIKDQPILQKQRDESLKRLVEPDLTRAKSAIDKEVNDADTRKGIERKDSKWITPYKYDLKLLQELQKNVFAEKTKLQKVNIPQITKICEHLHQATIHFYGEKIVDGELALAEAINAAQANPEYGPIIQIYRNGFQQKRFEYAAKQQAAATHAVIGAPPATPGAAGAPGVDPSVARAMAVASGQVPPPQPTSVMPQQVPAGAAPVQQPINPGMTPPPVGGVPQAGVPMPQGAYAQPVAPAPAPVAPAPVEEESTISMDTILMVAGGAVVLVLLLVVLLGKKKAKGE